MNSRYLKILSLSSVLATLIFSGCGSSDMTVTKLPHDTSKLGRTVSVENDWTWDVSSKATMIKDGDISIFTNFWAGLPDEIENFQYFIDMDKDKNTGFSGSGGWEVEGADYLIENGDVYKSLSNSEWKWKFIGTLQTVDLDNRSGFVDIESLLMRSATPTLTNIFNTDSFNVMIEVYDKNWDGDCNTITGIEAKLKIVGDTSSSSKKVITKEIDHNIDDSIDEIVHFSYDENGNIIEKRVEGGFTTTYVNSYHNGRLIQVQENLLEGRIITIYNNRGLPTTIDGVDYVTNIAYTFDSDESHILYRTETYTDQEGVSKKFIYDYYDFGGLKSIKNDNKLVKEWTYNSNDKIESKKEYVGGILQKSTFYEYDNNQNITYERVVKNYEGGINDKIHYVYGNIDTTNLTTVLKNKIGDSFISFHRLSGDKNRVIVVQKIDGFKSYTFFDISDIQNPTKLNLLVSEESGKSIRWFRVLDNKMLEYTVMENGVRTKVTYNYITGQ